MIDNDWRYLIGIIDCISAYLIVYPMLVKISWNMMETVSLIVTKIEWEMVPSGIFTWITWHSGKSITDFRVFNFPAVHLHLVRGFPSGPPCLMTPEGMCLMHFDATIEGDSRPINGTMLTWGKFLRHLVDHRYPNLEPSQKRQLFFFVQWGFEAITLTKKMEVTAQRHRT